ncbi:1-deoxy-D-xylulose-5-phosphate reductoisomerase, partial [Candidatus Woesearchaeota archaeon]|nr:1-deoxy-D-xylulose-5-phosphate reductoisomerase [Candidatus Woesearchaeota archaeon]
SLSLLGSTGSIGTQTLDIVKNNPSQFSIKTLACHSNIALLGQQIKEFNPELVCVFDKEKADLLKSDVSVVSGMDGLKKLAKEGDMVVNSLVGSIGILPTVEAIKAKKDVALANKETLVAAGYIVMDMVKKNDVSLVPIDSEHSAIFQCLQGHKNPKKIIITCSGGPFRTKSLVELEAVTKQDALKHPNWAMGNKITIDSATLMNKGLEVIEAHMLFGMGYDDIDVVVHPQSIVHSLVEFKDTSVLAQLGWPDMNIPIQYALSYPQRLTSGWKSLDLAAVSQLHFEKPDLSRFPSLAYAYDAGKAGGSMPCVMNAANEKAVCQFLNDEIAFLDIARLIKEEMENHTIIKNPELDELLALDTKIKND